MEQVAVFVDAGYLFAQGSVALFGERLRRGELALNEVEAIAALKAFAEMVSGKRLLRIYWYDGTSSGPNAQHLAIAYLHDTKVRLGFVNSVGEQKGVDSLLVTDMITLARNKSLSDAVLLAGDEDLRVGVQQAQEFGVRVHLIGIRPARGSQSAFLLQESDTTHEWEASTLAPFLSRKPVADSTAETASPLPAVDNLAVVNLTAVLSKLQASETQALVSDYDAKRGIPRAIDAQLLATARAQLRRDLNAKEKSELRDRFVALARASSDISS